MALSQLFWDVLMPWNLKSTYFSLKIIHFLSLNIWYVIYVVFWIQYWNLKLPHHCILFLFTICTVFQLFGMRVESMNFPFNPFPLKCVCVCSAVLNFNCIAFCILFSFLLLTKLLYVCQKKKCIYFFNNWVQFKAVLFYFYSSMFLARYLYF